MVNPCLFCVVLAGHELVISGLSFPCAGIAGVLCVPPCLTLFTSLAGISSDHVLALYEKDLLLFIMNKESISVLRLYLVK